MHRFPCLLFENLLKWLSKVLRFMNNSFFLTQIFYLFYCTFLYTSCPQSYKEEQQMLPILSCKVKVGFVKESSASLRQPVLRSSTATEGGGYALTGCLLLAKGNQPKADRHKMANGVVRIYKKLSLWETLSAAFDDRVRCSSVLKAKTGESDF